MHIWQWGTIFDVYNWCANITNSRNTVSINFSSSPNYLPCRIILTNFLPCCWFLLLTDLGLSIFHCFYQLDPFFSDTITCTFTDTSVLLRITLLPPLLVSIDVPLTLCFRHHFWLFFLYGDNLFFAIDFSIFIACTSSFYFSYTFYFIQHTLVTFKLDFCHWLKLFAWIAGYFGCIFVRFSGHIPRFYITIPKIICGNL